MANNAKIIPIGKTIGRKIRAFRKEQGLTQELLCQKAEISLDAVSRIEAGDRIPSLDTCEKIANGLNLSLIDLLRAETPPPQKHSTVIQRIVNLLEREPLNVQKSAEALIKTLLKTVKSINVSASVKKK